MSVAGVVILGVIGTGIAYVLNYQIITSEGATIALALVLAGVALTRRHTKAADEP